MLEILSLILDHLSVIDLIRCACVSRRLREMVYDDTRWVRKLQAMGCWDEGKARANIAEADLSMTDLHGTTSLDSNQTKMPTASAIGIEEIPGIKISAAQAEAGSKARTQSLLEHVHQDELTDGFDRASLSPSRLHYSPPAHVLDSKIALGVMSNARSIRGAARGVYGSIHAVLQPFYKDAVKSKHPSNAKIFRAYRDPNDQAQMLSQLARFANSDFTLGHAQRVKRLSLMVAAFEDAVAREYEQGLRIGDVDGRMRKYAHVLVTLNGGKRAVDRFVSENPLLRDGSQLGNPSDCFSPNAPDLLFLDEAHSFFGHLSASCNLQLSIAHRVFPQSLDVTSNLLSRVVIEIIRPYLEQLFIQARESSIESYIRAVAGTYEQCHQFIISLHPLSARERTQRSLLEAMIIETFSGNMSTYFEEELDFFRRKSEAEVTGWERQLSQQDASIESLYMSNVNRQADKRDFLSTFRKVVMAPVNALPVFPFSVKSNVKVSGDNPEISSTQASSRSSTPLPGKELANAAPARMSSPFVEAPSTELAAKAAIMKTRLEGIKSLFSLEVALNLVHMAKASIDRSAIFAKVEGSFQEQARDQCETIFILLLRTLGERHVRSGFDHAVEQLSKYNPRASNDRSEQLGVTPLAIFLELVNVGDLIQQMLDVFYEQEMAAKRLIDRNDFLSPAIKEKKRFEQMLDERVAAGLNKGIEVLMAEVEYVFATTQNVEDFNPGATGVAINKLVDISPTNTAVRVVELVSSHTQILIGSTDKKMLDVFNQEVGLRLFNALCKHLKRQRISVAGSIRLIRQVSSLVLVSCLCLNCSSDINKYFGFIQTLKNKDLLQYYKALRELSQIYLISPTDAKELATVIADNDRFLGIFRAEEVYEFAERRADWYQVKSKVEKAMYGVGCLTM